MNVKILQRIPVDSTVLLLYTLLKTRSRLEGHQTGCNISLNYDISCRLLHPGWDQLDAATWRLWHVGTVCGDLTLVFSLLLLSCTFVSVATRYTVTTTERQHAFGGFGACGI